MAQMAQVSILKKHISLDKEHSQTTQKKTLLMAPLPKSDRAQLSRQALSSPGTKHKSSKKASCSLTCFLMNLISTDTKRQFTALHRHEKGTQATGAVGRDTVPPAQTGGSKPCTRRFALPALHWIKGHTGSICSQTTISAVHQASQTASHTTIPPKTTGGQKMEFTPPRRSGLLALAAAGAWEERAGAAGQEAP